MLLMSSRSMTWVGFNKVPSERWDPEKLDLSPTPVKGAFPSRVESCDPEGSDRLWWFFREESQRRIKMEAETTVT